MASLVEYIQSSLFTHILTSSVITHSVILKIVLFQVSSYSFRLTWCKYPVYTQKCTNPFLRFHLCTTQAAFLARTHTYLLWKLQFQDWALRISGLQSFKIGTSKILGIGILDFRDFNLSRFQHSGLWHVELVFEIFITSRIQAKIHFSSGLSES